MSTGKLYDSPLRTSGAMYPGVPILKVDFSFDWLSLTELPKSAILILVSSLKSAVKMFSILMSR